MVYLVFGNQTPTIKNRVKKITKEFLSETDEMNFVKFDGETSLIQECVQEANYLPLGYDHKVVVVENCYFLEKPKPRNKIDSDQDYTPLIEFINGINEDSELILTVRSASVDTKNEIYNLIKQKGKIFELVDPDYQSWKEYVKKYCREFLKMDITADAIQELADRTNGDVALLQTSAQKLQLYKNNISYDDVCLMVTKPLDENAFDLFNFLVQGKNNQAVALFRDLKEGNTEPVTLISMLANQFRMMNQVFYLAKKGLNNDEIGTELNIKPIRAQILRRNIAYISEKSIHETLDQLFELDFQIKSGQVDRFYATELFLIKYKRK